MKLNIFTVETLQDFLEYEMIDKQIWQCWCYPQKQHIVQKLISTLANLYNTQAIITSPQMKSFS